MFRHIGLCLPSELLLVGATCCAGTALYLNFFPLGFVFAVVAGRAFAAYWGRGYGWSCYIFVFTSAFAAAGTNALPGFHCHLYQYLSGKWLFIITIFFATKVIVTIFFFLLRRC